MENLKGLFVKYKEIILYVFFGGLTTAINWVSYIILVNVLGGPASTAAVLWSTVIAQIFSIFFAYFTNRKWVFESKVKGFKPILTEMLKFFGCRGASIIIDMVIMYLGVSLMGINDAVMKLLSNVVIIIINYGFSKIFVFKKKNKI